MKTTRHALGWGLIALAVVVGCWGGDPGGGVAGGIPWLAALALLALTGVVESAGDERRVRVGRTLDGEGKPRAFSLNLRDESITLEPRRTWHQVDHYKWVTRGLIEEPQSFHVGPDGTVDINGEKIQVTDPDGVAKLELEVNKRHQVAPAERPVATSATPKAPPPDRVVFHARLDHLGHLQIDCLHGADKVETSLRGLATLIQNGLMLPPRELHVDPLQRYVEIDGTRFDVTPEGASALNDALNLRYAAKLVGHGHDAVEIKDNPGSATGFDIHFVTIRAGVRFEVKGHLSQANLDILQDPAKCDLLRPDIVLKLSPPFLFIRRRRPDGGEEPIPEFPDLRYRSATAAKLQGILNHPLLRRGEASGDATSESEEAAADLVDLRVTLHPENRRLLWLESRAADGAPPKGRALTHHNLAELQHAGVFRSPLEVALSLDSQTLTVRDETTREEQSLTLDPLGGDELLERASQLLTAALKPPRPFVRRSKAPAPPPPPSAAALSSGPAGPPDTVEPPPAAPQASSAPSAPPKPPGGPPTPASAASASPPSAVARDRSGPRIPAPTKTWDTGELTRPAVAAPPPIAEPEPDAAALFGEASGRGVIEAVFSRLGHYFCLPVQSVRLSLPHVFTDRLFEILSFEDQQVVTLFDLRSDDFYGFYRAHLSDSNAVLVYACKGLHVEFGAERCLLELALGSEPHEFKHGALLGFAQDANHNEIFIVTPAFKTWVKPHERACEAGFAHFITAREFLAAAGRYHLVWPENAPT